MRVEMSEKKIWEKMKVYNKTVIDWLLGQKALGPPTL